MKELWGPAQESWRTCVGRLNTEANWRIRKIGTNPYDWSRAVPEMPKKREIDEEGEAVIESIEWGSEQRQETFCWLTSLLYRDTYQMSIVRQSSSKVTSYNLELLLTDFFNWPPNKNLTNLYSLLSIFSYFSFSLPSPLCLLFLLLLLLHLLIQRL